MTGDPDGPEFYDSADVGAIPSGAAAMLPVDGKYAVTPEQARRFGRVRWYTVTGDGWHAGAIDWEEGNPCFTPAHLRRFVRIRRRLAAPARIYVERALAAEAIAALRDFADGWLAEYPHLLWWIPTLDGELRTADELSDDLRRNWDAIIPAGQLWADQWTRRPGVDNRLVDVSRLFLPF